MMWRNSLSFSSKLVSSSIRNPNSIPYPYLLSPFSSLHGFQKSSSTSATSPSVVTDPLRLAGLQEAHRNPTLGSVGISTLVATSLLNARATVDLARHYGRCYWELSKARLSLLVVATSGTGYVLGSGHAIDYAGLCFTCAGTMMVAAAANSLNQVFEIKNDAKMKRTKGRPLPSRRLTVSHAITWASTVGVAGTGLLACKANMLAAGLAASNLFLYAFIYTPLKQIHPINTWVGAVVGAIPPLLGWVAASGEISLEGLILPAALYFWQIPHFMALAYLCRDDYAAGGFKMFSLGDASGQRTALVALRNCLYLLPLGYLAYDWGITSIWFFLESTLLALAISATAISFCLGRTRDSARRMFHASLLYLPVFMSGLLFHRVTDSQQHLPEENSQKMVEFSSSSDIMLEDDEYIKPQHNGKHTVQARPLVAYASVAPFPFLPAPSYPIL